MSDRELAATVMRRGVANGSYKRVDDKDVKLSYTEIYALQSTFVPSEAEHEIVQGADASDLDEDVVDAILVNESLHHPRSLKGADSREERMRRLNMIDEDGGVKLAGLLAAGYFPQQFFPRFCVDVIAFPGLGKGAAGSVHYLDRVTCEGPLHAVIDDATAAVMRNLRTAGIVVGIGREDVPEIPRAVVREAIANAVVHRDYDARFSGQFVSVELYDDRIEVTSPGGLWGGKTLENIDDCGNDEPQPKVRRRALRRACGLVSGWPGRAYEKNRVCTRSRRLLCYCAGTSHST